MEFKGLRQKDLADLLNSRPRASEILNHIFGKNRAIFLHHSKVFADIGGAKPASN